MLSTFSLMKSRHLWAVGQSLLEMNQALRRRLPPITASCCDSAKCSVEKSEIEMDFNAVKIIARQELVINIRNKWTGIFAVAFGALVLAISYFGMVTAGTTGFQGFARTSASLLNLVLYLVPRAARIMSRISRPSEHESIWLVFSQALPQT